MNEFMTKLNRSNPVFPKPELILCDGCGKEIKTEIIDFVYCETSSGRVFGERAICEDCKGYYEEIPKVDSHHFTDVYLSQPPLPNVDDKVCLNCGAKLEFDKVGYGYMCPCLKCNWKNDVYNDPNIDTIALKEKVFENGVKQIAYPTVSRQDLNKLPKELRIALEKYFNDPEILTPDEHYLISKEVVRREGIYGEKRSKEQKVEKVKNDEKKRALKKEIEKLEAIRNIYIQLKGDKTFEPLIKVLIKKEKERMEERRRKNRRYILKHNEKGEPYFFDGLNKEPKSMEEVEKILYTLYEDRKEFYQMIEDLRCKSNTLYQEKRDMGQEIKELRKRLNEKPEENRGNP